MKLYKKHITLLLLAVLLVGCSHRNYPTSPTSTVSSDSQSWHFPLPGAKVISPYGPRGGRRPEDEEQG
jgi:hypothetical protein